MISITKLFCGLGYPFTAGGMKALDKLIDALPPEAGSEVFPYWEWDEQCEEIIALARLHGKDNLSIILIGHSWGCLVITYIVNRLNSYGIPVQLVVAIDPTALPSRSPPMLVAKNVEQVIEFWSTRGIFNFPKLARRADPKGSRGGMYTYLPGAKPELIKVDAGHIPCASHPVTVNRILTAVEPLL